MIHNVRINGEVKEIDCELGSGILDKNGKEIFEGDKITANGYPQTVKYESLIWYMIPDNPAMADLLLCWHQNYDLEVVGHVNAPPFKDTGRAWSPQLHDAYNRLLDACIARKSPEAVCEAALAVVQAAKAAHPQMRFIAGQILQIMRDKLPVIVEDIKEAN